MPQKSKEKTKKEELQVQVLYTKCIGAGYCVFSAPATFEFNDDRKAKVIDTTKESEKIILEAAKGCPVQAIYVYQGKKQLWPKEN